MAPSTLDATLVMLTPALDPLAELRTQRALLLSAIREVEARFLTVLFRDKDEDAAHALTELLLQMREHLMLAAFVDRSDTVRVPDWCSECKNPNRPAGSPCPVHGVIPVHDTDRPPADPTLTTCTECDGTGYVKGDNLAGVKVCTDCYGVGAK